MQYFASLKLYFSAYARKLSLPKVFNKLFDYDSQKDYELVDISQNCSIEESYIVTKVICYNGQT